MLSSVQYALQGKGVVTEGLGVLDEQVKKLEPDVIVIDQSLNNLIWQLRKLLSADSHISIDTIRGVGYRLKNNS